MVRKGQLWVVIRVIKKGRLGWLLGACSKGQFRVVITVAKMGAVLGCFYRVINGQFLVAIRVIKKVHIWMVIKVVNQGSLGWSLGSLKRGNFFLEWLLVYVIA